MRIQLLVLILGLWFFGCDAESSQLQISDPDMKEDTTSTEQPIDSIRYLALGDSYTIGESVSESLRWPNQLAQALNESEIPVIKPDILARTGWTTNELMAAIEKSDLQNEYQLVSLLIGVNNQYRGYAESQQIEEFELLLQRAISFAQGDTSRVFVVSIPDYGVTPFGQSGDPERIAREIDRYNEINQAICVKYGVRYFDITPISREALTDPDLIAGDRLHPSGLMYERWVTEVILPGVKTLLQP